MYLHVDYRDDEEPQYETIIAAAARNLPLEVQVAGKLRGVPELARD